MENKGNQDLINKFQKIDLEMCFCSLPLRQYSLSEIWVLATNRDRQLSKTFTAVTEFSNKSLDRRTSGSLEADRVERMFLAERCYRDAMQFSLKLPALRQDLLVAEAHLAMLVFAKNQCTKLKMTAAENRVASSKAYAAWRRVELVHRPSETLWLATLIRQNERLIEWRSRGGIISWLIKSATMSSGSEIKSLIKHSEQALVVVREELKEDLDTLVSAENELKTLVDMSSSQMVVVLWVTEQLQSNSDSTWEESVTAVKEALFKIQLGLKFPERPIEERERVITEKYEATKNQIAWLQVQADFADYVASRIKDGLSLIVAVKNGSLKYNVGFESESNAEAIKLVPQRYKNSQEPPLRTMSDIISNTSGKLRKVA